MEGSSLRDLVRWGSILTLVGIHVYIYLYGTMGGRRGRRMALAHLVAFDWALMMGVTAGRTVAPKGTPFWSPGTVTWGLGGVFLLFVPAWLLFRYGIRWCGTLLLPVMPTDREQRGEAERTVRAYAWGFNYAFYREEDGRLGKLVESNFSPRGVVLGKPGPGLVMADSHYAIPLTVGMRDTRAGGHGIVFTNRWEEPRSPVDLRPQARSTAVHALTRDGIPVKVALNVIFQVDRRRAKGNWLYPFDPEAVFAAVHAQTVGPPQEEEPQEVGWDRIVANRAAALLRDAIAQRSLDQLLEGSDKDKVRGEVKSRLEQMERAMPHGIQIAGVSLGNIDVESEDVLRQRAASWRATWEQRRMKQEAEGEAAAIRLIEEARADALRQMIAAITEAFQQLADTETPVSAQVIALRFIDVLEDAATSPSVQGLLPESVQWFPGRLRLLMGQAAGNSGEQGGGQSGDSK